MPTISRILLLVAMATFCVSTTAIADEKLEAEASQAMERAAQFFSQQVATHGGYVYRYSADLSKREGEGKTDLDTVWVQPPGTPTVGEAFTDAYVRTRKDYLLKAAKAAAECLIQGQLRSGGWTNQIDFAPELRGEQDYRVDQDRKKRPRNWTTFDDDKTQSAMRFLMKLDQALGFKDERIHESISFALDSVLKAQFPNGAWPQGYQSFPDPAKYPVKQASFPDDWPRTAPGEDYWIYYTFNDNAMADTVDMLLLASKIYGEPKYRDAAFRAGDFMLLAQLPEPQPAWAQQYNFEMQPVWARKFEPAAVSGGETNGILVSLLQLYEESGDKKYLEPIPRALAYLRRSVLPNGQLARFYELKTNKPLYFTRKYELTYDDGELPTHYGFKVSGRMDSIEKSFQQLSKLTPQELAKRREKNHQPKTSVPSEKEVQAVIKGLDDRGAWVEDGSLQYHGKGDETRRIISSKTFCQNLDILSRYLRAASK